MIDNADPKTTAFQVELNGVAYDAYEGETVVDVAARAGIEIPTLCHDPRLEPAGACRVCLVEVEGERVDGGVDRSLDHVLDGGEAVVDGGVLHGAQYLDDAAEAHQVHSGQVGLAQQRLFGECADRAEVGERRGGGCRGVHEQGG